MSAHDPIGSLFKLASMIEGKRECTRIPVHSDAILQSNGDIIEGKVENLSMTGAFFTSAVHLKVDNIVTISIFNTLKTQTIQGLKARVVRVTEDGIALQFEKALLD
jgi:hypothetical protein